ncbi:hypothetical protein TNCV_3689441 [Trichonephila clavipes]|uniref:Uncharacterized protein n=1 Tax=Trichonephila clavipes TaxID=2585209 RepID=A0A8X6SNU1_TRICX|nr:hypothetical protein TNCV_3689441 [Trichonephila clavipes]
MKLLPQLYCWEDNVFLQAVILAPDEGGVETSWKSAGGTDAVNFLAEKHMFPMSITPYLAGVAPLYLSVKEEERKRKVRIDL